MVQRVERWALWLVALGFVEFPAALAFGHCLAPDRTAAPERYTFWLHMLSAMGMSRTPAGADNGQVAMLFNGSLIFCGAVMVPFFVCRTRRSVRGRGWAAVTALGLIGCCLAVGGVALAPYDRHPRIHDLCANGALGFGIPSVLLLVLLTAREYGGGWRRYQVPVLAFVGLVLVFDALGLLLKRLHGWGFSPTMPILQKVTVAAFLIWMLGEMLLFRRALRGGVRAGDGGPTEV